MDTQCLLNTSNTDCEDAIMDDLPVVIGEAAVDLYEIDAVVWLSKLAEIWRTYCPTVNRRLLAIAEADELAPKYKVILPELFVHSTNVHAIKLIPRTDIYSTVLEFSSYVGDLLYLFVPLVLTGQTSPHITGRYAFYLKDKDNTMFLQLLTTADCPKSLQSWMAQHMFPALVRWHKTLDVNKPLSQSNCQINREQYAATYLRIKREWGKHLADNWPECTDPTKFVYEDCAIAAYLYTMWTSLNCIPSRFVDLGCGNGVLVYLLNKLGVPGYGVDLRRRKIWSILFSDTELLEEPVDPKSEVAHLKSADFIIGNHSDELTPWIPRLSVEYKCNFFVLPCCPYDFEGKYNVRKAGLSVYASYLNYIEELCKKFGFDVKRDRLSIPSTKRIAFFGVLGDNPVRKEMVSVNCDSSSAFCPRRPKPISNCTGIDRNLQNDIVKKIIDAMLSDVAYEGVWRKGKSLTYKDILDVLSAQDRSLLKHQDGGLQTFIRNHAHVFKIENSRVELRDFRDKSQWHASFFKKMPKSQRCRMFTIHPDGCPMSAEACIFDHS